MTKTNKRRRVASVLLALVMLLSLMPSLELPAHAFWDDYDDGFDCPNCDHYHFGSEYMCDCLFCTIDCNYECWVETHCNDCGVCFGDTPYWCETCYKCADCMEDTHCSTCGKCYIGEDDQLCGECHKGSCCSITICDSCGFCDDCANDDSDPMHCSLCNACFGSVDECVDDGLRHARFFPAGGCGTLLHGVAARALQAAGTSVRVPARPEQEFFGRAQLQRGVEL